MKLAVSALIFLSAIVALAQTSSVNIEQTGLNQLDDIVSGRASGATGTSLQDLKNETELRTIRVYNGDAESTGPAQGSKETLTTEQLQLSQPADIDDLVKQSANVTSTNSGRARGTTIQLRGLDDKRILTTIDGARLNMRMTHTSGIMIEPSFLKKVDILSSAGSASSAQGALAGSIKLQTIDASDFLKEKKKNQTGGFLEGKTQSANSTVSVGGSAFARAHKHEVLAAYANRNASDKNLSNGKKLEYSSFKNQNALASWSYRPSMRTAFKTTFEYLEDTSRSPLNPQDDFIVESSLVDNTFERQLTSLQISNVTASSMLNTDATLYRVATDIGKLRVEDKRNDLRSTETLGIDFKQKWQLSTDIETSNEVSYGLDVFSDQAVGTRNDGPLPNFPKGESQQGGAFVQYKWNYNDLLLLHMGMRYDSFSLKSKSDTSLSYSGQKTSRRIGVQFAMNESSAAFANWSEGINPPRFNDLFVDGLHFSAGPFDNFFIPNTELKAEVSNQGEYGVQFDNDQILGEDRNISFKHTEYVWQIENYVYQDFNDDYTTTQFVNQPEVYLRGRETTLGLDAGNLGTTASFSQVRSWLPDVNLPMGDTPADVFKLGATVKLMDNKLLLGYQGSWYSPQNRVPTFDDEVGVFFGAPTPSYNLDDVFMAYKFKLFRNKDSQINLRINNIFNKEYRPHASTSFGPTVDWRVSLRVLAL